MRSIILLLLGTGAISILATPAFAQNRWSKLEIGAGLSAFVYQGDLTTHRLGSIETTKPGLLVFANYKLRPKIMLQGSFAWGALKGDESIYSSPEFRKQRALYFRTPVKELSAKIIYTFRGNQEDQQYNLMPYIGTGINLDFFNVKRDANGFQVKYFETQPSVQEGLIRDLGVTPTRRQISIPIVVGVRRPFTERFDLFAEANYRILLNDYVDGFSYAGNPSRKDHFYTISLGAVYKFRKNNSIQCPSY